MSEIVIYEDAEGKGLVQVRLDGETVWLTQKQMADLFESSTDNIWTTPEQYICGRRIIRTGNSRGLLGSSNRG